VGVLLGDRSYDVELQWLKSSDVEIDVPERAVSLLDDLLIRETAILTAPTQRVG
jgi:hypothetical protein